jgi:hypothetical protein
MNRLCNQTPLCSSPISPGEICWILGDVAGGCALGVISGGRSGSPDSGPIFPGPEAGPVVDPIGQLINSLIGGIGNRFGVACSAVLGALR